MGVGGSFLALQGALQCCHHAEGNCLVLGSLWALLAVPSHGKQWGFHLATSSRVVFFLFSLSSSARPNRRWKDKLLVFLSLPI